MTLVQHRGKIKSYNMHEYVMYICMHICIACVCKENVRRQGQFDISMLTHAARDFILKRTSSGMVAGSGSVAGSGTVSLCGFGVAQTRAAREKRQRQEDQDRVANLATLFRDPVAFQNHLGDSNCGKRTLDKSSRLGEFWR